MYITVLYGNLKFSQTTEPQPLEMGFKDIVHRLPIGTIYGTDLTVVGVIVVIVSQVHVSELENTFSREIVPNDKWPLVTSWYPMTVLTAVTVVLAALTMIFTFVGIKASQSEWVMRMKGKVPLLVLLVIAFTMIVVWRVHQSLLYFELGLVKGIDDACDNYVPSDIKKNQTGTNCIIIPFVPDEIEELCDPKKIRKLCNHVTRKMTLWLYIYGLGDNLIGVGMATYCVCLAVNYTLIRLQQHIDLADIGRLRY